MLATSDLDNGVASKLLLAKPHDRLGKLDFAVGCRVVKPCSGLTHVVETPTPDFAFLVYGERSVVARTDYDCFAGARAEDDLLWRRAMDLPTLQNLAAQLTLLACSPRVDIAMCGENNEVIVPCDDGDELLGVIGLGRQIENRHRRKLMLLPIGETQQAFNRLHTVVSNTFIVEAKTTYPEGTPDAEVSFLTDSRGYAIACRNARCTEAFIDQRLKRPW